MDFDQREYEPRQSVVERYRWMGWLYSIVGCFIVALLVLMFLDLSNKTRFNQEPPEAYPSVQIAQPAISNYSSPTSE